MDYLQEGINLRAMGQKDPLVEWQREGYEMFGGLMKGIAQDFVRYVMHVQVVRNDPQAQQATVVSNVQESSADTAPTDGFKAAAQAAVASGELPPEAVAAKPAQPAKQAPVVNDKDDWSKTPRNALCPCGSGKKYKFCHGAS
jgi:preprotein translocase subunit SecA